MSGEGFSSPNMSHYPGQYQFTIHPGLQHDENQRIQKNVEFTFSTKLNCLYVKRGAICPFGIFTSDTPPSNSEIKVVVLSDDDEPVMRCRAHTEGNNQPEDFISPLHFMRCENQSAIYHCCKDTGTLAIFMPNTGPESMVENVENFTFLCSSKNCIKKKLFIKFSLINSNEVLGYHIFGLHVCSTPGRDRMNHEAGKTSRKRKRHTDSEYSDVVPPSQSTQEIFNIFVKKPWIFEYLLRINRGLELLDAVPVEDQQMYLKKHWAKQAGLATSSQTTSTCTSSSSSSDTRCTLRRILVKS